MIKKQAMRLVLVVAYLASLSSCVLVGESEMSVNLQGTTTGPMPQKILGPRLAPDRDALYLLLRSASTPFSYKMRQIPLECILGNRGCSAAKDVSAFASGDLSASSALSWSPDGSAALIVDDLSNRLLLFDPKSNDVSILALGIYALIDQVIWNPDGQRAAISLQGKDPYSSTIGLIDLGGRSISQLSIELGGIQVPVGWRGPSDLVIRVAHYGSPDGGSDEDKLVTTEERLYQYDLLQKSYSELLAGRDINGSMIEMSPDESKIAFTENNPETQMVQLIVADINGASARALGPFCTALWSPDGHWIAAMKPSDGGERNALVFLTPDGSSRYDTSLLDLSLLLWLPDSQRLLAIRQVQRPGRGGEKSQFLLVSPDGRITELPPPDLPSGYVVSAITLRSGE